MIFFLPLMILVWLCLTIWRNNILFIRGVLVLASLLGAFIFVVPAMVPIINYLGQGQPDPFASEVQNAVILPAVGSSELVRGIVLCFCALFFPAVSLMSVFSTPSKKFNLRRSGSWSALACAFGWAVFGLFILITPIGYSANQLSFWLFYGTLFIFPGLSVSYFYIVLSRWIYRGKFESDPLIK